MAEGLRHLTPTLPLLALFRNLDESDPDIVILRGQDDSFVSAFSARGVTKEGVIQAAKEAYRGLLIRDHRTWQG